MELDFSDLVLHKVREEIDQTSTISLFSCSAVFLHPPTITQSSTQRTHQHSDLIVETWKILIIIVETYMQMMIVTITPPPVVMSMTLQFSPTQLSLNGIW